MPEQTTQKVDLRGLTCPEPVLRAKKLFDDPNTASVEALVDDDVCVNNLQRLARSLKAGCTVKNNDGYYTITLERSGGTAVAEKPSSHAPAGQTLPHAHESTHLAPAKQQDGGTGTGTVILLSKDTLGAGDEDFSRTLMNLFLQTTFESGFRPNAILLLNSGVRLMAKDSQALKVLNDFKSEGCEVLACGLCVEYYKLKEDIPKEQITNMFAICEYLFAAAKIIQP
jgi:selenium metabolism protein YedF